MHRRALLLFLFTASEAWGGTTTGADDSETIDLSPINLPTNAPTPVADELAKYKDENAELRAKLAELSKKNAKPTPTPEAGAAQTEPENTKASKPYWAVGGKFDLHKGEHRVTVGVMGPGAAAVLVKAKNMNTGDKFQVSLDVGDIHAAAPVGFPSSLTGVIGFQKFLLNAFGKEEGRVVEAEAGGRASLACSSREEGETYTVKVLLTFGTGLFANELPVTLSLPVKARSTAEEKQRIELRLLHNSFSKQLDAQAKAFRHQVELLSLQMNQRVFFGVTHSIHIKSTVLVMQREGVRHGISHSRDGKKCLDDQGYTGAFQKISDHGNPGHDYGCLVKSVPSTETAFAAGLFALATTVIPQLPSAELAPLQLCRELQSISFFGHQITDLKFLAALPELTEITLNNTQIRDLSPLATLPKLRTLRLTHLNLAGGGGIDTSPLAQISTLENVYFTHSQAVAKVDTLAGIEGLRHLDTAGTRVTDRTAFANQTRLKIVPE